jgi:hypothetical protein
MKSLITVITLAQILVGAQAFAAKCENSRYADSYKRVDIRTRSKTSFWSNKNQHSCTGTVYISHDEPALLGLMRKANVTVTLDNCSNFGLMNAARYSVGNVKLDTDRHPYYAEFPVEAVNGWSSDTADFIAASDDCHTGTKIYLHF